MRYEVARVGGILLIMGVLHTANVVALPVIGSLLTNSRRLERSVERRSAAPSSITTPPLGPGTWVLRIEPAPEAAPEEPSPPVS